MSTIQLLPGIPVGRVMACLQRAPGNELESGKFESAESSSALAVNTFGWFLTRPDKLPRLPHAPGWKQVESVDLEYCVRFPWSGGRHPWLDAAIVTDRHLIGVESKRFEPFRDCKKVELSTAYDRPVWGNCMEAYEALRDNLRSGGSKFEMLDAVQLLKHAFGLVTDARRKARQPHLHYLFAEPAMLCGKPISISAFEKHRAEVDRFAELVADAEVSFSACSHREWLESWTDNEVMAHGRRVIERFAP